MKFTFGHLWIFIGAFMAFILYLAISAASQKIDLETEKYYEEEVAYQDVIDKSHNYNGLDDELKVNIEDESLAIIFPPSMLYSLVSGKIIFRCNADAESDFSMPIHLNESGSLTVLKKFFQRKGYYKVMIDWTYQNKGYYIEQEILID